MPRIITADELYEEVGAPPQNPSSDGYTPKSVLEAVIDRVASAWAEAARAELQAARDSGIIAPLSREQEVEATATPEDVVARAQFPQGTLPFFFDKVRDQDGRKLTETDDIAWWAEVSERPRYLYQISGRTIEVLPVTTTAVKAYFIPTREAVEMVLATSVGEINAQIKQEAMQVVEARTRTSARIDAETT